MHLRRMHFLLLFGGKLCTRLLGPLGLQCCSSQLSADWFLSHVLSITESGILTSPTIILLLSVFPFWSVHLFCIFTGAHVFIILVLPSR